MAPVTAILAAWDLPRRVASQKPLALRSLAGLSVLEHVLVALRAAGIKKIYVGTGATKKERAEFSAAFKGVHFFAARGWQADGAFSAAAHNIKVSGSLLLFDGLCPLADKSFIRRLASSKPAEDLVAAGCGHACGDEHAAAARVSAATFRKVFGGGRAPRGLPDWLAALEAEGRAAAVVEAPFYEDMPVRDLGGLAEAARMMQAKINHGHMARGVQIVDPANTWIDAAVKIGAGTQVLPYSFISGQTRIGKNCQVGPFARIRDCAIADDCRFEQSTAEESRLRRGAGVGPFSRLRSGTDVGAGAKLGNFCEFKNAKLGTGVKAGHLSYLGDASVGAGSNIGAGTITANYDGRRKHRTVLGEGAFTGSNTVLVAPVKMGAKAKTGAGSVVLAGRNVPAGKTAVGTPARVLGKVKKKKGK